MAPLFYISKNKHNLNDETLKSLTPGIIEVSREEFLEVIF